MAKPDTTEEPALIPEAIGAEVIRGLVRYPGHLGDVEVGSVDIGEYLYELKEHEVMMIVAPLNPMQEMPTLCGLCGTPYHGGECPMSRAEREEAKRVIEERLSQEREECLQDRGEHKARWVTSSPAGGQLQ